MAETVSGKVAHDSADDSHIFPVKVGGVYRATPPSVADGDVVDLLTDEAGRLQIDITSGAISSAGDVAHDGVDSGNPVKVGGYAQGTGSLPTITSANGDRVNRLLDRYGRSRNIVEYTDGTAITGDATYGVDVDVLRGAPKLAVSGSASSATNIIASTDALNYNGLSLQLSGTWSATVLVEGSNDNTNFTTLRVALPNASVGAHSSSLTANGIFEVALPYRYVRVRCSSYSSGTIQADATLTSVGSAYARAAVTTEGTAAQGATASGNPVRVGGVYQSSPSTLSDGQIGTPLLSDKGILRVVPSHTTGVELTGSAGVQCQGQAAHDAAIAGSPVRIAGRARTSTLYSAVSADDVADLITTTQGELRIVQDVNSDQNGYDTFSNTALTNTAVAIKASRALLGPCQLYNPSAAVTYFQFFNVAAASVTLGTTPPTRVVAVPTLATLTFDFGKTTFGTAASVAATTTATGSTAPATAGVIGLSYA